MKTSIYLTALCLIFLCCKKEPSDQCSKPAQWTEIELPDSIEFDRTIVYLNGKEVNYAPIFTYYPVYNLINYRFSQQVGDIVNDFGFSWLPLEEGEYTLHTDTKPQVDKAGSSFGQTFDEDINGYSYKLEESVNGFFNVEHLDSINQTVRGRFKVAFCRTSTNGNGDLGLPEHLLFQGVFNTKYSKE